MSDAEELNEILRHHIAEICDEDCCGPVTGCDQPLSLLQGRSYVQWSTSDEKHFFPTSKTVKLLIPGVYEIKVTPDMGIFFELTPVLTTGLLRFPETNSERVVSEIQKFWTKGKVFEEYNLTHKRGIILWGPPGCHAKGTKIRLYDGTLKNVEDIKVGDSLMGANSKPRKVLELRFGKDLMYCIKPNKGEGFVVNGHHILHMARTRVDDKRFPPTVDMTVNDYMGLTKCSQRSFKLVRTGVEYKNKFNLEIDPYFLGIWLGDGTVGNTAITSADEEIKEFIYRYSESLGLTVTCQRKTDSICSNFTIVGNGSKNGNKLRCIMKDCGVFESKHIPDKYLFASREDRLRLLAGLVDTEGGYSVASNQKFCKKGYKGYFEIIQKRTELSNQIVDLARGLGFGVTISKVKKGIKKNNFIGEYWRINIYGNLQEVPVLLPRKKALAGLPNKDPMRVGIKEIKPLGEGEYFGFTLSDDHLYLTDDYMIHHNSGKSCCIKLIMQDVVERGGVVLKFTHPSLFIDGVRKFREIQPETPIVVLMEDIDSILEHFSESEVLNILDGVNQIDKAVFLATTNYPERLGARIINRPSRFDKRFRIGHPNAESRRMYFDFIIGGKTKIDALKIDLDKWVEDTDDFSIAHLKELFTAVVILGDSYDEALETLIGMREEVLDSKDDDAKKEIGFATMQKKKAKRKYNALPGAPPGGPSYV